MEADNDPDLTQRESRLALCQPDWVLPGLVRENGVMDPRLIRFVLASMSSDAFEELVFALVLAKEPSARRLKPPDVGRDIVVEAPAGELAWQAKHHASGIQWGKCRESLEKALEHRDPKRVTFVFPTDLTGSKEPGLVTLRRDFPQVEIPEPWGASTLVEMLRDSPGIRRDHIDRVIGIDHQFERESWERGAALKEGWDLQTQAAIDGPLAVLGLSEEASEALAAVDAGQSARASELFEVIADSARTRMPAVADVLLLRAAGYAADARQDRRAGELYLAVSRFAARRADSAAEYAAFRALWLLPESERWRIDAAIARAVWPERSEDATVILLEAAGRSIKAGDESGALEWTEAFCDAAAAQEDWIGIRSVCEQAAEMIGAVENTPRLAIELDLLHAKAALGTDVSADMNGLLLTPLGRTDAIAAWVYARWGSMLAYGGSEAEAAARFEESSRRWRAAGDSEDEIAEAIFSKDALSQLIGTGQRLDQLERIAAADLRGRTVTTAVLADRKEADGLRAWLAGQGYEARRALLYSWSIHRRAGHLGGCARLAHVVRDMFQRAEEWPEALFWAINVGDYKGARDAAKQLAWGDVDQRLRLGGALWQRGPTFEAVAAVGAYATDADIARLVPDLLLGAAERSREANLSAKPGPAARKALASVLCGLEGEDFEQALSEVVYETEHTPYPPADALQGLLLATDAGLCDTTVLIAEVFCIYGRAHVPGYAAALQLFERSKPAQEFIVDRASDSFTALVLAAWLDLPDDAPALAARASDVIARALEDRLTEGEILCRNDRGRLARWSTPEQQLVTAKESVTTLVDRRNIDVHRYEAGEGIEALASRMAAEAASSVLDELLARADDIGQPSQREGGKSHPNEHFARFIMRSPPAGAEVRAIALRAVSGLAATCGRLNDVQAAASDALASHDPPLRRTAVQLCQRYSAIAQPNYEQLLADEDPTVAVAALPACIDAVAIDDPRLTALCSKDVPLAVRCSMLALARHDPLRLRPILQQLAHDPHVYVRRMATDLASASGT
jgi:hypothetical protein